MPPLPLLLLPGLDGTGRLFARFAAALPDSVQPRAIALPTAHSFHAGELSRHVAEQLPSRGRFAVVAESHDRLLRHGIPAEMARLQRRLELREIPAPHLVLQAEPERSARIVTEFLARSGALNAAG